MVLWEKEINDMCFTFQGGSIQNRETKRCLEIAEGEDGYYKLVVQQCSDQSWKIQNLIKPPQVQVPKHIIAQKL